MVPEQISGWLAEQYPNDPEMQVSHETIYQVVVRPEPMSAQEGTAFVLAKRSGDGARLPRCIPKGGTGQGQIRNMVMISQRPA